MTTSSRITALALGTTLLAVSLSLSACATRYAWYKEGGGEAAVEQARADCKRQARGYDFLEGSDHSVRVVTPRGERYSEINVDSARFAAGVFEDCMRDYGFTRVEREEP